MAPSSNPPRSVIARSLAAKPSVQILVSLDLHQRKSLPTKSQRYTPQSTLTETPSNLAARKITFSKVSGVHAMPLVGWDDAPSELRIHEHLFLLFQCHKLTGLAFRRCSILPYPSSFARILGSVHSMFRLVWEGYKSLFYTLGRKSPSALFPLHSWSDFEQIYSVLPRPRLMEIPKPSIISDILGVPWFSQPVALRSGICGK